MKAQHLLSVVCGAISLLMGMPAQAETSAVSPADPVEQGLKLFWFGDDKTPQECTQFLKNTPADELLKHLDRYLTDTNFLVRSKAAFGMIHTARQHDTPDVKRRVVTRLLKVHLDDPGVDAASLILETFTADDFDEEAKRLIHQGLTTTGRTIGIVRLAALADMKEEIPELRKMSAKRGPYEDEYPVYQQTRWRIGVAMARLGDEESIRYCVDTALQQTNVTIRSDIMDHMLFIQRLETVPFFKQNLFSKDEDIVRDDYNRPISRYMAFTLSCLLADFPVNKCHGTCYTKDDIEICRKWMNEQKEFRLSPSLALPRYKWGRD